jgi:hypothetical protein
MALFVNYAEKLQKTIVGDSPEGEFIVMHERLVSGAFRRLYSSA